MTSEIIKATTAAVALADGADPFQAFADAVAPQFIVGKLLKFSKGDWISGEYNEPVEQKALIAGLHALATGWVRWSNNKPAETIMTTVNSRQVPPRRHELGHDDEEAWEADDRGQKKDPWQFTTYLPMIGASDGEIFTFSASSRGALDAVGKLSRTYAAHRRRAPSELPIVALGSSGYQHPRREYGFIKTPLFTVSGWAEVARFNETMVAAGYEPPDIEEAPAPPPNDMDDDIPF
ncbi:hypothetical protein [Bradyrhizobium sp. CCBAU 051011]|uniref:hypothetical protein n=1 Tax=Bradyrhizobium sp. CCBAU 051011 TaxID=858422 RepID=UPI00137A43B9|nr:hypothetical protein [Bradyrhizobium sp. CCBAU 051011]